MADWPTEICFTLSLQDTRQDGTVRTPMDTGPGKARRRFSAVSRYLTDSPVVTVNQRDILDFFYAETLEEGALSFNITDPNLQEAVTARFTGPIAYAKAGSANYRATISLEILP